MTFSEGKAREISSSIPRVRLSRRQKNGLAWIASGLLHAGLLLAFLSSASGQLVAADNGGDLQGAMTVSVVPASALREAASPDAAGGLQPLLARYSDQPPIVFDPVRPSNDMTRLLQRYEGSATSAPTAGSAVRTSEAAEAEADQPALTRPAGQDGRGQPGAATAGSTGSLWGAVEPCWRDVAAGSTVPVVLDVAIDRRGQLSTPPQIIRHTTDTLDEQRLTAEARALSALAACLPRGDLRFSGKRYRLEFLPRR
jgi:hypothetical protein